MEAKIKKYLIILAVSCFFSTALSILGIFLKDGTKFEELEFLNETLVNQSIKDWYQYKLQSQHL